MNGGTSQSTSIAYNLPDEAIPLGKAFLQKAYDISTSAAYDELFENYELNHALPYADFQYIDSHYPEVEGLDKLGLRGLNGNATVIKADFYLRDILDGKYLDGTSFLSNDGVTTHNEFADMLSVALAKPTNTFGASVRTLIGGSPYLMGDLSGENIAYNLTANTTTRYNERASAGAYYKNSRMEKDRQVSVLSYGVDFAGESIKNADMQRKAGLKYRLFLHGRYKTKYELWQDEITEKYKRIEILGNGISRLTNAQSKRTDTYHKPSPVAGMAAGAMAGAPLAVATGGASIAIGAVLGLIAGQ